MGSQRPPKAVQAFLRLLQTFDHRERERERERGRSCALHHTGLSSRRERPAPDPPPPPPPPPTAPADLSAPHDFRSQRPPASRLSTSPLSPAVPFRFDFRFISGFHRRATGSNFWRLSLAIWFRNSQWLAPEKHAPLFSTVRECTIFGFLRRALKSKAKQSKAKQSKAKQKERAC